MSQKSNGSSMQNNILFSIIIPTYNRASLIGATIHSLLNQSYSNFEMIIVDDGSTDNTQDVVTSIKDSRVSYFFIKNAERGAARNFGAGKANGEYINFFDSDDIAYSNHLSEAYKMIIENDNPIFFHLAYDIKTNEGKILKIENKHLRNLDIKILYGNLLSCNGVFVRKDIAIKHPFSEIRELSGTEDWLLWIKLGIRYKFLYSTVVTTTIINHDERSVLQFNEKEILIRISFLLKELNNDKIIYENHQSCIKYIHAHMFSYMSLHAALVKQKRMAFKYLRKAIWKNPKELFNKRMFVIVKYLIQ